MLEPRYPYDRCLEIARTHFPELISEPVQTLDEALQWDRLMRIQSHTDEFRMGTLSFFDGDRHVWLSAVRYAVIPLVERGRTSGPTLLAGLKSDLSYVRGGALEGLKGLYNKDIPYAATEPPTSPLNRESYVEWERVVTSTR